MVEFGSPENGGAAALVGRRPLIVIASWPVSRVLYGGGCPPRDGHSSWTPVARRLTLPTRMTGPETGLRTHARAPSLFGIAPGGVCRAGPVARPAVGSYPTVSPLPQEAEAPRGGTLFCGTFPEVALAGRYPAPCLHGARTFLPGGLSTLAGAAVRPTDGRQMAGNRRKVNLQINGLQVNGAPVAML